jgi:hypothetical protein
MEPSIAQRESVMQLISVYPTSEGRHFRMNLTVKWRRVPNNCPESRLLQTACSTSSAGAEVGVNNRYVAVVRKLADTARLPFQ